MKIRSKLAYAARAIGPAALGVVLGLGGTAGASTSTVQHPAHVCRTPVPSGATRHVVPAGDSLYGWTYHHVYGGLADVLPMTFECGPGVQQKAMAGYLDGGKSWDTRPAPRGGLIVWVNNGVYH